MSTKDTLIIVPAFNEQTNLKNVINDLKSFFDNVLIIDDGSDPPSYEVVKKLGVYYSQHEINLGQGADIDTGLTFFLKNSKYKYVITFDGDGQNRAKDAKDMLKFAKKYKLNAVLGSRFKNKNDYLQIPLSKRLILSLAKIYEKIFFKVFLTDAHNGLRVMSRYIVENYILPIKNSDMGHATEISYKICKSNCDFSEYPVRVKYKNKRSQNPINAINIIFKDIFYPL